ncbi:MAG TPA: T9SS type A sorting domain-containing protein [Bacteroidia bacterium]|nr:T9SS type A sorting domain-containing protein [Bacteroidia bacterium]
MKKSVSFLSILCIISVDLYAQTWINVQNTGYAKNDSGNEMCSDNSGNVYVTGYFTDSIRFGTTTLYSDSNRSDVFVVKYNAAMSIVWAKRFGGNTPDEARAIKTDASGNIYIAGGFNDSTKFGSFTLNSPPAVHSIFVVKLNSSGIPLWASSATANGSDFWIGGLGLDANNNIYLTGFYAGVADFGNSVTLSSVIHPTLLTGSIDIFIAKYSNSGTCQWARTAGSYATEYSFGIAVKSNGTAYITGFIGQTSNFSGSTLTYHGGGVDGFIAGYNTSGTLVFLTSFYSDEYEAGYGITLDAVSNIYITGLTRGFAVFDTDTVTPHGSYDMFVAKYNSSGDIQWVQTTIGSQLEVGRKVAVDEGGNVYVGGENHHGGTSSFPGINFTSKGYHDPFVAKYNHVGEFQWAQRGGSYRYDYVTGIALIDSGKVFITGNYGDTARFSNFYLPHNGITSTEDFFIAKVRSDINTGTIPGFPLCAGTSISVPFTANIPFVAGNVFTAQLSNANGYFANAVNIGSVTSTVSGIISATIPAGTANGTGYRIRVVSSDSVRTGGDNGTDLTIWALPNVTIASSGTNFCSGDSLQLISTTAAGNTFQWQLNSGNISGATASSYYANATGDYKVIVTEPSHGCTRTSNTIHATKRNKPAATITPGGPLAFCTGGSVLLSANTGTNLSYQWKKNNVNISGATGISYSATTTGSYKVAVTSLYGCIKTSTTVSVTVYSKPPANITAGGPVSFCAGDSVVFTANSGTGLSYQWKKDNAAIPGATTTSYTAKTPGIYKCTITNANSCSKTSNVITVSVPCRLSDEVNPEESVFNMYPNPVDNKTNVTYTLTEKKNVTIEIINSIGEVVETFNEGLKQKGEYTIEINTASLASGYYLVRLTKEENTSYKKLIKL